MKEHLKKLKEAFEYNQTDALILVDDGTIFIPKAKNLAIDYARKNGYKWQTVKKEEVFEPSQKTTGSKTGKGAETGSKKGEDPKTGAGDGIKK